MIEQISRIGQVITQEESIQLLHGLVAIPSPSYEEANAARFLVDWMAQHHFDQAFVDESGSAVGIIGQGAKEIVLLGHIDTFPGFPPVKIENGKLYGRGAVDAKGPLSVFAAAARRAHLHEGVRVIVIGAVEEEAASSKGAHYALTQYRPELCIIGEPSGWDRITLGYKGRLLIDWHWEGPLAHSAGPVRSPAEEAVAYWQHIVEITNRFNEGIVPLFDRLDVSLRSIHTENQGAFGQANMTIGFRLPLNFSIDNLLAQLSGVSGASIRTYGYEAAFSAPRDTILTRALRGAIRQQDGQPRFLYKTGTADMNVVGPIWNCPIAAYGPGDSTLDHTPDEHINLEEYWQSVQILTIALERLSRELSG